MAVVAVAGGCYVAAGQEAAVALIRRAEWNWNEAALYGGVWALGMVAVGSMHRAGWLPARGDRDGREMVQTALERGELPAGARDDRWRRLLRQEADEARPDRRLATFFMGLVAVLVVAASVVGNGNAWSLWLLALGLAAFIPIPVRRLARQEERAEALLPRLDAG